MLPHKADGKLFYTVGPQNAKLCCPLVFTLYQLHPANADLINPVRAAVGIGSQSTHTHPIPREKPAVESRRIHILIELEILRLFL